MADLPNPHVTPLPPRPNLERQHKLAKRLLRAVWAGEPEALQRFRALHPDPPVPDESKLSDAQLVTARGYGFASWAQLKQRIESLTKTPLELWRAAVSAGDAERVRELFARHAELRRHVNDPIFGFDQTALFVARQNLPLVDVLIEHGADVNRKTGWWAGGFGLAEDQPEEVAKPLLDRGVVEDIWVAVRLDRLDRVRQLLDADASLVTAPGGDGKHPLHYAQSPAMVDLLVGRGADANARDVDHTSTPTQYLIGNEPVVRRLLKHGADADVFLAAALGDANMMKRCLAADPGCVTHRLGVEPWVNEAGGFIYNWTLGHGKTPLDVAHEFGHAGVYRLLLDAAPPKVCFLDAAWRGDVVAARALLDANPDLMEKMTHDDHAALNRACWWYRPDAVRAMLELGFNRHIQDHEKMTPLDRAGFHGHADCLARLLDGDPDPPLEWQNQYDSKPLGTCIYGAQHGWDTGFPQDHVRCAELLLAAGAAFKESWLPTGHDEIDGLLRKRLHQV